MAISVIGSILEDHLKKLHSLPSNYYFYKWEVMTEVDGKPLLIEGCIPDGIYKSGKRKGRNKIPADKAKRKSLMRFILSDQQVNQINSNYENETGNCFLCQGSGQVWKRISAEGTEYQECKKCSATGKKQEPHKWNYAT